MTRKEESENRKKEHEQWYREFIKDLNSRNKIY